MGKCFDRSTMTLWQRYYYAFDKWCCALHEMQNESGDMLLAQQKVDSWRMETNAVREQIHRQAGREP
jgi:hypothetical protein